MKHEKLKRLLNRQLPLAHKIIEEEAITVTMTAAEWEKVLSDLLLLESSVKAEVIEYKPSISMETVKTIAVRAIIEDADSEMLSTLDKIQSSGVCRLVRGNFQ